MSEWANKTLAEMTLDEKLTLLGGHGHWETAPVQRLGIPSLRVTDGPNGARGSDHNHGPTSTSFPVGSAMGATFDPQLIKEVGRALATETRAKGSSVLLGPTVNIARVPNAGRNFECFSEDPTLSGTLAAAYIRGLQIEGVGACIKHFVCNDQEYQRHSIDAVVNERALREIYLEPFRIAVEAAQPWAAMSAYNTINGVTASEHPMLDEILRDEFGFDGAVISDWWGTYGPGVAGSGLDLEMPGPPRWMDANRLREAITDGSIDEATIDRKAHRLLALIGRTGAAELSPTEPERAIEPPEHRDLARRVAVESMVLLKNDSVLPISGSPRITVIGELAALTPNQGGGSSRVNPHRVVSILEGLEAGAPAGSIVEWAIGATAHRYPPPIDVRQLTSDSGPGFRADYYRGTGFAGEPIRTTQASGIRLHFDGRGDDWIEHDDFSLRLSGCFVAKRSGAHVFAAGAAGRLRVFSNGSPVVDRWEDASSDPQYWELVLTAGEEVDLIVEYGSRASDAEQWVGIGCHPPVPEDPIAEARRLAAASDLAVVVVGLTPDWESEGFDRPDLGLPGRQDELVDAITAVQPNTVVVTVAGAALEMPWVTEAGAVLHTWYGGQEIGTAVADVLCGREDPGGRLPVTFPRDSRQHPGLLNYPGEAGKVRYGEGVYVGYRGFDRLGLEPQFPFGHGLSYTTFEIDDVAIEESDTKVILSARLSNVGERRGTEVVQVFARDIGEVDRRLVGFRKLRLAAGESAAIEVDIGSDLLRWWDPALPGWAQATGDVEFEIRGTFATTTATASLRPTEG